MSEVFVFTVVVSAWRSARRSTRGRAERGSPVLQGQADGNKGYKGIITICNSAVTHDTALARKGGEKRRTVMEL